jgi:hypothetical protein
MCPGGPFDGEVSIAKTDTPGRLTVRASWTVGRERRTAELRIDRYEQARQRAHAWGGQLAAGVEPNAGLGRST